MNPDRINWNEVTPEDIIDGAKHPHPEVEENPEAMLPASAAVKEELLGAMTELTAGQPVTDGYRGAELRDEQGRRVQLRVYEPGSRPDGLVGLVYRAEELETAPGVGGAQLVEQFYLKEIPDGLDLEKIMGGTADSELVRQQAQAASADYRTALDRSPQRNNERISGMSMVSEAEADELTQLINLQRLG